MTDARPDPTREIRPVLLRTVPGPNFWSRHAVTRLDLAVGAYDEISTADVPGLADVLVGALPGLWEHRCSIGERGGFVTRLRRGTYAPHVVEHVALELQSAAGHDVGYGRARGGDRPGEYTVVFSHLHAAVGLRAGQRALEMVTRAFAGRTVTAEDVEAAIGELRRLGETPEEAPPRRRVACAVTGGGDIEALRRELGCRGVPADAVGGVEPARILVDGLPFTEAEVAVVLDAALTDVPARYRDPELAARLVATVADAVPRGGIAVVPTAEREVQERARDAGCRVAVFTGGESIGRGAARLACAAGWVREGRIALDAGGRTVDGGPLHARAPAAVQVAGALAAWALGEAREEGGDGGER